MSIDNDEAERLALLAQQGDSRAEEQALRYLREICVQEASRFYRGDADNELLLAEAIYWAWRAIHIWDPARGGRLRGTARQIIRRKMQQDVKTSRRQRRYAEAPPVRLDAIPAWFEDADESLGNHGAYWIPSSPSAEIDYFEKAQKEQDCAAMAQVTAAMTAIERKVFEARMASYQPKSEKVMALIEYQRRGLTNKQADNALIRLRRRILMWAMESDTEAASVVRTWLKSERGSWVLGSLRKWAQDKNLKFDAG